MRDRVQPVADLARSVVGVFAVEAALIRLPVAKPGGDRVGLAAHGARAVRQRRQVPLAPDGVYGDHIVLHEGETRRVGVWLLYTADGADRRQRVRRRRWSRLDKDR